MSDSIAWVSGGAHTGYTLHVNGAAFPDNARDMVRLDGITFEKYRAAQDIANAIKAHHSKQHKLA